MSSSPAPSSTASPQDLHEFLFHLLDLPAVKIRTFVVGKSPYEVCEPVLELLKRKQFGWVVMDAIGGGMGDIRIVFDTAESATTFMQDAEIVKAVKEIEGGGRLVGTSSLVEENASSHLTSPAPGSRRWKDPALDPFSRAFSPRAWIDSLGPRNSRWVHIERLLPGLKMTGVLSGGRTVVAGSKDWKGSTMSSALLASGMPSPSSHATRPVLSTSSEQHNMASLPPPSMGACSEQQQPPPPPPADSLATEDRNEMQSLRAQIAMQKREIERLKRMVARDQREEGNRDLSSGGKGALNGQSVGYPPPTSFIPAAARPPPFVNAPPSLPPTETLQRSPSPLRRLPSRSPRSPSPLSSRSPTPPPQYLSRTKTLAAASQPQDKPAPSLAQSGVALDGPASQDREGCVERLSSMRNAEQSNIHTNNDSSRFPRSSPSQYTPPGLPQKRPCPPSPPLPTPPLANPPLRYGRVAAPLPSQNALFGPQGARAPCRPDRFPAPTWDGNIEFHATGSAFLTPEQQRRNNPLDPSTYRIQSLWGDGERLTGGPGTPERAMTRDGVRRFLSVAFAQAHLNDILRVDVSPSLDTRGWNLDIQTLAGQFGPVLHLALSHKLDWGGYEYKAPGAEGEGAKGGKKKRKKRR